MPKPAKDMSPIVALEAAEKEMANSQTEFRLALNALGKARRRRDAAAKALHAAQEACVPA